MMSPYQPYQNTIHKQTNKRVQETAEGITEDAVRKLKGSHPTWLAADIRRHAVRSTAEITEAAGQLEVRKTEVA